MRQHKKVLLISSALTMVGMAAPAKAEVNASEPQSASPTAQQPDAPVATQTPPSPSPDQDQGVADIVVTANRREQNLQRVPITVAAFTSTTLNALSIRSTVDVPQLVPGFVLTRQLASANSYLRGVGTSNSGFTSETPVAVYIDGLYLPNSAGAIFSFNNIERIEVLKGPQGTLYGRNTTGGLIQVITRDPTSEPSVDASIGYANYNTISGNFYGSTPLTGNLFANIAATYTDQQDGWARNVFTGKRNMKQRDLGFQGKLLWEPASGTKITLRGFYDRLNSDQGVLQTVAPSSVGVDGSRYLGEYLNSSRIDAFLHQEQYNFSLKAEQSLGFANLSSITGYIHIDSDLGTTQNGIPGNPVSGQAAVSLFAPLTRSRTFSQELQLSSKPSSSRLQWIAGLFYYHDNSAIRTDTYGTCVGTVCAAAPIPTRTTGFFNTRSYAAYGEATYDVLPSTHVTVGLRYTSDTKTLSGLAEPAPGRPNTPAALPAGTVLHPGDPYSGNPAGIVTDVTFGKLTYRAVIAQDITNAIHAYASYNRGFKSGGFNPINFSNVASRPEVLDAEEIGVKSFLFNRLLRLNVAGFHYTYQDIQLRTGAAPAPPGGTILYNAAKAHISGVDVDFEIQPAKSFSLNGGFEYLHAIYASFPGGTCTTARVIAGSVLGGTAATPCDLTGNRLPNAPEFSFNLGATYTLQTSAGAFVLTASDSYKSTNYFDPDNRLKQEPYHLLNASLTWTEPQQRFSSQLFVKNLLGTYYFSNLQEANSSTDVYLPGAPRTYGVVLRYHF